jgi:hypothetical protein
MAQFNLLAPKSWDLLVRGCWPAGPDGNPRTRSLIKLAHSRRIESHGVFSFLVDHLASLLPSPIPIFRLAVAASRRRSDMG